MPPKNKKYKKIVVKRSIIVQGFNIQGSGNNLKGVSVTNNTAESGTTEEEIIVQGFNLAENSRNNDFENAIAKDNRVVISYESDNEIDSEKESMSDRTSELEENTLTTNETKTILLLGSTGSGKSTLANILTSTNTFPESSSSTSQTRKIQNGEFIHNNQKYQVTDTVGIGDTKLVEQEVLNQLLQAIYQVKNGIQQIFLVISGRLTKEEIATYHLLRDALFTKDICKHIAIVRTNFPDFQDQQKCEEDREKIQQESQSLSDIANSSPIIYVNNLPNDSQTRESSRQILLAHLTNHPDIYKTTRLDELINQIGNYLNKVERVEIVKTKLKEAKNKQNNKKEIKQIEKDLERVQQEQEFAFKEIMNQIEDKKEWKEWKKWAKKHGVDLAQLGVGAAGLVATVVVPLACRLM